MNVDLARATPEQRNRYFQGKEEGRASYTHYRASINEPMPFGSPLAKEQPGCSPECPCVWTEEGWQVGWTEAEESCGNARPSHFSPFAACQKVSPFAYLDYSTSCDRGTRARVPDQWVFGAYDWNIV